MEIWDAYDENFTKVRGVTLIRGTMIPKGIFHLVCDVIVKHKDGSYLIMQRDKRKRFGGMWEATAGGSALQNETPLKCAIRELHEETGIKSKNLIVLGHLKDYNTIYVEFLCITNCKKDSVILQEGETIAYKWITKNELICMKKAELLTRRVQNFIKELQS